MAGDLGRRQVVQLRRDLPPAHFHEVPCACKVRVLERRPDELELLVEPVPSPLQGPLSDNQHVEGIRQLAPADVCRQFEDRVLRAHVHAQRSRPEQRALGHEAPHGGDVGRRQADHLGEGRRPRAWIGVVVVEARRQRR